MQILYIIGNGFDLNLGLKTSYKDFYHYYQKIRTENPNVQKLKKHINDTYDKWADLELELGNYTKNLKRVEEFDDIIINIGEELSKYLKIEEKELDDLEFDQTIFFKHLCYPENLFLPADKELLLNSKRKWQNAHWHLYIYTLNYTRVIEKIVGEKKQNITLANRTNNAPIELKEIRHIHGYLDNNMVLGVNDTSQIKNQDFHSNQDIIESMIKSEINKANKSNVDREFTSRINSANLICIFGSSIGDTDNKWWELIGQRLTTDCHLIIFARGEVTDPRIRHLQARTERSIKEMFLGKTNLSEKEITVVENKIFVGLNTGMFNNLVKSRK